MQRRRAGKRATASGFEREARAQIEVHAIVDRNTVFNASLPPRSSIRISNRGAAVAAHAGSVAHDSNADDAVRNVRRSIGASLQLIRGIKHNCAQRVEPQRSVARG